MPEISPLVKLAPEAQIRALERRGLRPVAGWDYRDVWLDEHAHGFTVAKMTDIDMLADVVRSLLAAEQQGRSYRTWAKELTPMLEMAGWWGRKPVTPPGGSEAEMVQLGSPRRLKIIFAANLRASQAAADWETGERLRAQKPYRRYVSKLSENTRASHAAWHGTVLPSDHVWWATHMPPNDYNCRCTTLLLSAFEAEQYGFAISEAPPPPPPGEPAETVYVNERTGAETVVPWGVHPAWANNPGAAGVAVQAARLALEKVAGAPPPLAAELAATLPASIIARSDDDFRNWVDAVAAQPPRGESRVVGVMSSEVQAVLAANGRPPDTAAIVLTDHALAHLLRDAKAKRGTAIDRSMAGRIPSILRQPDTLYYDGQDPAVLYVADGPDSATKLVVRQDFKLKIGRQMKITTNQVRTAGQIDPAQLKASRYHKIK